MDAQDNPTAHRYVFETVPGYFLQDDAATNPDTFSHFNTNFGLKDHLTWRDLVQELGTLNRTASENTIYKLLFIGRHGEAVHNVAIERHGLEAWKNNLALLEGDGTTVWFDAHLTQRGIAQANNAKQFWFEQLTLMGTPLPQSYYTSPLTRCCETLFQTFETLQVKNQPFAPVVKELLREHNGMHTCDRRSRKSQIQDHFNDLVFEDGFSEEDILWTTSHRETEAEMCSRLHQCLEDIFEHDANTIISLTTHSGATRALLCAINHRIFPIGTGGILPVLVEATRVR